MLKVYVADSKEDFEQFGGVEISRYKDEKDFIAVISFLIRNGKYIVIDSSILTMVEKKRK